LAGVVLTYGLNQGRFKFEHEEQLREAQRTVVAEATARGTEYAREVDSLLHTMEREDYFRRGPDPDGQIRATIAIIDAVESTYPLREPYLFAVQKARMVIIDPQVGEQFEQYAAALAELLDLVSHCTDVTDEDEDYDQPRGQRAREAVFTTLAALMDVAYVQLRPRLPDPRLQPTRYRDRARRLLDVTLSPFDRFAAWLLPGRRQAVEGQGPTRKDKKPQV
jgi:hypothetical protein